MAIVPRLLIVALLALALPATAQVYKWVDKDGKVHYSDKKPRDPKASGVKDMGIESKPTDQAAVDAELEALKARGATVDQEAAARKDGEAAAAQKKQEAEAREKQCAAARSDLTTLEGASRMVAKDASGKDVYATGADLEARRAKARENIAKLCG